MLVPFTEIEEAQILEAEQEILSFLWEMLSLGWPARHTS